MLLAKGERRPSRSCHFAGFCDSIKHIAAGVSMSEVSTHKSKCWCGEVEMELGGAPLASVNVSDCLSIVIV